MNGMFLLMSVHKSYSNTHIRKCLIRAYICVTANSMTWRLLRGGDLLAPLRFLAGPVILRMFLSASLLGVDWRLNTFFCNDHTWESSENQFTCESWWWTFMYCFGTWNNLNIHFRFKFIENQYEEFQLSDFSLICHIKHTSGFFPKIQEKFIFNNCKHIHLTSCKRRICISFQEEDASQRFLCITSHHTSSLTCRAISAGDLCIVGATTCNKACTVDWLSVEEIGTAVSAAAAYVDSTSRLYWNITINEKNCCVATQQSGSSVPVLIPS